MNWDELSLTVSSWPADYEGKKRNIDSRKETSTEHPHLNTQNLLPLNTYLDKSKWEETLCLPLGATVEGLTPVFNERRECAIVQVPVNIYIGLP